MHNCKWIGLIWDYLLITNCHCRLARRFRNTSLILHMWRYVNKIVFIYPKQLNLFVKIKFSIFYQKRDVIILIFRLQHLTFWSYRELYFSFYFTKVHQIMSTDHLEYLIGEDDLSVSSHISFQYYVECNCDAVDFMRTIENSKASQPVFLRYISNKPS